MNNMRHYEQARNVPAEAKKKIGAGRLKGMTDVNPMWRIKKLTEMFGPCGVGWWYEITDKRIEYDEITNQKSAFVDILLFFVDTETGEHSRGIPGTGGASFVNKETSGYHLSDECYKMALTDAISVAAKALGVAADVYFEQDKTKYANQQDEPQKTEKKTAKTEEPKAKKEESQLCPICGKTVEEITDKNGKLWKPIDILKRCGGMCPDCLKAMKNESKNQ